MNTDYKIIAAPIADKLHKVMPHIISSGQTRGVAAAGININDTISLIETQLFYDDINNTN
eukprot:Pgem_evm1s3817